MGDARSISYGWGRGHIRANNRAFAVHGMAQVARDRAELTDRAPRRAGRARRVVTARSSRCQTAAPGRARALRLLGRRASGSRAQHAPEHRRGGRPRARGPASKAPGERSTALRRPRAQERTGIAVWVTRTSGAHDREPAARFKAAHLGVQREQRGNGRGRAPSRQQRRAHRPRESVDGDLRGDHRPRLTESGREHGGDAADGSRARRRARPARLRRAAASTATRWPPPSLPRGLAAERHQRAPRAAAPTTASRSRRSTRSPRRRSARTTSRPSPRTSAGCTTLSGARARASSCSASPPHDEPRAAQPRSGAGRAAAAAAHPQAPDRPYVTRLGRRNRARSRRRPRRRRRGRRRSPRFPIGKMLA